MPWFSAHFLFKLVPTAGNKHRPATLLCEDVMLVDLPSQEESAGILAELAMRKQSQQEIIEVDNMKYFRQFIAVHRLTDIFDEHQSSHPIKKVPLNGATLTWFHYEIENESDMNSLSNGESVVVVYD